MSEEGEFPKLLSPRPLSKGLVEVYTGDGKGKTSAALGVVLRAVGHGLRVFIVYFMKGDTRYGEERAFQYLPNVSFARFGFTRFVNPKMVRPEEKEQARLALAAAREAMLSAKYDVIVLDEVNVAVAWKLLPLEEVISLIEEKPKDVELILTGRYADPKLIELADLVTEMVEVKHPFTRQILARQGIDY